MKKGQLIIIAKGMGYEVCHYNLDKINLWNDAVWVKTKTGMTSYNPLKNNDQMVELILKRQIDISFHPDFNGVWARSIDVQQWFRGDTIEEAVALAGLASMEKEQ